MQGQWRFFKGGKEGMLLASLAKCNLGRISQNYAKRHLVVKNFVLFAAKPDQLRIGA
jgi:hypothetical protein